ncbi:MAG: thermonuclease family protein [Hyphomicrobium sp.]
MRILLAIMIMFLWSRPALPEQSGAPADATAVVEDVTDGSTIVLDRPVMGSRVVRLAGIEAPRIAPGPADETWPLAEDARQTLIALSLGRQIRLSFEGLALDRYRRLIAHVHDENGHWLQGEMVARGMARVRSLPDNRSRLADLLTIEAAARAGARGIWADPFYRVRSPREAEGDIDSFQIVEGVVIDRARVRDRIYLNFGPDWRTDFTVSIEARLLPAFEEAKLDPMDLKGRTIRVRGWIESRNGPLIEATHAEQIEVLPEQPPESRQDS